MKHILLIALCLFGIITTSVSSQVTCGLRNATFWPWHVNIQHVGQDPDVPACGGTILNELFVITAGHCVYDLSGSAITPSKLIVTIDRPSATKVVYAKRVTFPNVFDVNKFKNDVVLVKLDQSIEFSEEVRPICFSEEGDESPEGSVTIPIEMQNGRTVRTVEWRITNYTSCHGTNRYIFNASYEHSICMGSIRNTDKFQLNRGSALMIQRNNVWHLVGILLYTVGPNGNIPTYGGGLVLSSYAKAIKKIANKHLVRSLSDQKCDYYNAIAEDRSTSYFTPYILLLRRGDSIHPTGCVGTLISERFILTAAPCTQSLEVVMMFEQIIQNTNYRKFNFHFHPNDIHRNGIALIELNRNVSNIAYFINCLWTNEDNPMDFGTEIKRGSQFMKLEAKVQYRPEKSVGYRLEKCYSFMMELTGVPGDVLSTKKAGEKVQRVVGLLTSKSKDCGPQRALNVVDYLDWIEEVVWIN